MPNIFELGELAGKAGPALEVGCRAIEEALPVGSRLEEMVTAAEKLLAETRRVEASGLYTGWVRDSFGPGNTVFSEKYASSYLLDSRTASQISSVRTQSGWQHVIERTFGNTKSSSQTAFPAGTLFHPETEKPLIETALGPLQQLRLSPNVEIWSSPNRDVVGIDRLINKIEIPQPAKTAPELRSPFSLEMDAPPKQYIATLDTMFPSDRVYRNLVPAPSLEDLKTGRWEFSPPSGRIAPPPTGAPRLTSRMRMI